MNSASFTQPVTPGSLVTIFGANRAAATLSSVGLPLPISLGGTSVSVNGLAAPLLYVSPSQINLQIPAGSLLGTRPPYSVQVSTSAGSGLSSPIPLVVAGPGLFTTSISGCGYAAALNVSPTGPLSVNTGSNSISPGSYVALFGTGLGTKVMSPPDGTPATAPAWVSAPVIASVGGLSAAYNYAGAAPGLVGVDQINVLVPSNAPEGCAIPVDIKAGGLLSPTVAISIHGGGGKCIDPSTQAYGRIALLKAVSIPPESGNETDSGSISFISGPGAQPPSIHFADQVTPTRECPLPGFSHLPVGLIQVQANDGTTLSSVDGMLPVGFIRPGSSYNFKASGSAVSFQGSATLPPSIQFQSAPAGTISASRPITISWSGGDFGSLVRIALTSAVNGETIVRTAPAPAGNVTFESGCTTSNGQRVCSFGIPPGVVQVTADQVPVDGGIPTIMTQGLTQPVQIVWDYRFALGAFTATN